MSFECSFDGIPFCLDVPRAHEFLLSNMPLKDTSIISIPRIGHETLDVAAPLGLPTKERLQLNKLHYPNGIRWAEWHGLMTSDQVGALPDGGSPHAFILQAGDNQNNGIETPMYLLPPRLISQKDTQGLYLISLVDERFYWQYASVGALPIDETTQWTDILNAIAGSLGIALSVDGISPAYGMPNQDTDLATGYANAAALLQAVCYNIGHSLVRNYNGSYNTQTATTSANIQIANLNNNSFVIAGGPNSGFTDAVLPSTISVTFPLFSLGGYVNPKCTHLPDVRNTGDVHVETIALNSLAGYGGATGYPFEKIFHDSYKAEVNASTDTTLTNAASVTALATQIAQDYCDHLSFSQTDATYSGIQAFVPEGLNDFTFECSSQKVQTRVMHKAWAIYAEDMQHGDGTSPSYGCVPEVAHILVDSQVNDSSSNPIPGLYEGHLQTQNDDLTWSDINDQGGNQINVYFNTPNQENLAVGSRYLGKRYGTHTEGSQTMSLWADSGGVCQ